VLNRDLCGVHSNYDFTEPSVAATIIFRARHGRRSTSKLNISRPIGLRAMGACVKGFCAEPLVSVLETLHSAREDGCACPLTRKSKARCKQEMRLYMCNFYSSERFLLGEDARRVVHKLADRLAQSAKHRYSEMVHRLYTRISAITIRAQTDLIVACTPAYDRLHHMIRPVTQ
jgi:hypothetical protein